MESVSTVWPRSFARPSIVRGVWHSGRGSGAPELRRSAALLVQLVSDEPPASGRHRKIPAPEVSPKIVHDVRWKRPCVRFTCMPQEILEVFLHQRAQHGLLRSTGNIRRREPGHARDIACCMPSASRSDSRCLPHSEGWPGPEWRQMTRQRRGGCRREHRYRALEIDEPFSQEDVAAEFLGVRERSGIAANLEIVVWFEMSGRSCVAIAMAMRAVGGASAQPSVRYGTVLLADRSDLRAEYCEVHVVHVREQLVARRDSRRRSTSSGSPRAVASGLSDEPRHPTDFQDDRTETQWSRSAGSFSS